MQITTNLIMAVILLLLVSYDNYEHAYDAVAREKKEFVEEKTREQELLEEVRYYENLYYDERAKDPKHCAFTKKLQQDYTTILGEADYFRELLAIRTQQYDKALSALSRCSSISPGNFCVELYDEDQENQVLATRYGSLIGQIQEFTKIKK